jgi:hypothetical protein
MSLTSYRAAPPRDNQFASRADNGREGVERELGGLAGLAATDSSASVEAVPWALRVFTAEFGMGSGVWPLAMATRPAKLPGCEGACEVRSVWSRVGLGAARGRWCGAGSTRVGIKPIERLVPVSCGDCSLSTSGLSTWWSTTALGETWF